MPARQLNIRLKQEERDLLDAMAFIEEVTPTDMARQIIQQRLSIATDDDLVVRAKALRAEARARSGSNVSKIHEHKFDSK